ncbi:DUF4174 domain-containing protein [Mycolicibacterium sp. F2034L]|uniref:DUF4174 domain-containing protein n=1 Tax=Mycolicibacterium sp. F2034L TaxID=2926422 RepID=UPI001FF5AD8C|nr:DUF4174 domain-containing protein [Mycolicibacterium sp. F2034L]MCK0177507.1 DUF4174 domain-containing protein [Mycolicibacterium sp. F2034L]
MVGKRGVRLVALTLVVWGAGTAVGTATAAADELGTYLWERRPLLVFTPTATDARLVETLSRVEASRCAFDSRDMVLGVVTPGDSTLDGRPLDAAESQELVSRFAVDEGAFSVLLIGKDGGEKLRVDEVPDLEAFYAVIDGMPMRGREMGADSNGC